MANKTASSGIVRRWQAGTIRSSFAGTDSPSKTLDITGEGRFSSDLTLGNGSTPDLIFEQGDSSIIGPNNANFVIRSRGNDAAEGIFLKGADGAGIQILKDGKVGIGTTAPSVPLEVVGVDDGITISSASSDRPHLRLVNGTTNMLQLSATGAYAAIGDGTDGNRYMSFKGGSVGIGNVAPGYKLDVTGTFRVTG